MRIVILKSIAFIAVVFSAEGFWIPDEPTPPVPANEIKTPVIIGNVNFYFLERFFSKRRVVSSIK